MYRDASNFKEHYSVVLEGEVAPEDIKAINEALPDGHFVPGVVGLPSLEPEECSDDEDGPWHEIVSIELTDKKSDYPLSAANVCETLKSTTQEQWEKAADAKYTAMFGDSGGEPGM